MHIFFLKNLNNLSCDDIDIATPGLSPGTGGPSSEPGLARRTRHGVRGQRHQTAGVGAAAQDSYRRE